MKYSKNAAYNYENNRISVENGYTKWYDKDSTGKKLRLAGTYSYGFMIAALIGVSRAFTEDIKAFGTYPVEVKLYNGISASMFVMIGE